VRPTTEVPAPVPATGTASESAPVQQTEVAKVENAPVQQPVANEVPVQQTEAADVPTQQVTTEVPVPQQVSPETPVEEPKTEASATSVQVEVAPDPCMCNMKKSTFPIIYFSFNSIWIEPDQRAKVKEIADRMKADKSIRIRVTGWCDPIGSEAANQRVALQRAEAVKRVLGQWLIPADRIETAGGGVCHGAASYDEARNAISIEIL